MCAYKRPVLAFPLEQCLWKFWIFFCLKLRTQLCRSRNLDDYEYSDMRFVSTVHVFRSDVRRTVTYSRNKFRGGDEQKKKTPHSDEKKKFLVFARTIFNIRPRTYQMCRLTTDGGYLPKKNLKKTLSLRSDIALSLIDILDLCSFKVIDE